MNLLQTKIKSTFSSPNPKNFRYLKISLVSLINKLLLIFSLPVFNKCWQFFTYCGCAFINLIINFRNLVNYVAFLTAPKTPKFIIKLLSVSSIARREPSDRKLYKDNLIISILVRNWIRWLVVASIRERFIFVLSEESPEVGQGWMMTPFSLETQTPVISLLHHPLCIFHSQDHSGCNMATGAPAITWTLPSHTTGREARVKGSASEHELPLLKFHWLHLILRETKKYCLLAGQMPLNIIKIHFVNILVTNWTNPLRIFCQHWQSLPHHGITDFSILGGIWSDPLLVDRETNNRKI